MYSLEGPVHTYSMYLYRYCFIDLYTHHLHIPLSTHLRTHYRTSVHTPVHTLHTPYTNAQLAVHIHSTYSLYCTFLYVLVHKDSYTTPYARIYSIHICTLNSTSLTYAHVPLPVLNPEHTHVSLFFLPRASLSTNVYIRTSTYMHTFHA